MNFIALITIGGLIVPCLIWFSLILKNDKIHQRRQVHRMKAKKFFLLLFVIPLASIALGFLLAIGLRIAIPTPSAMMKTNYERILFFTYATQVPSDVYNQSIAAIAWSVTWPLICIAVALLFDIYFRSLALPRLRVPLLIAFTLFGGALFYSLHFFFDARATQAGLMSAASFAGLPVPLWIIRSVNTLAILSKISLLSILLLLQSYLGPIFTAYLLSAGVYQHLVQQKSHLLASTGAFFFDQPPLLMDPALNWIFKGFPPWSPEIFLMLQLIYNILMNGGETFGQPISSFIQSYLPPLIDGIKNFIRSLLTRFRGWQWTSTSQHYWHEKINQARRNLMPTVKPADPGNVMPAAKSSDPAQIGLEEWEQEREAITNNLSKLDP